MRPEARTGSSGWHRDPLTLLAIGCGLTWLLIAVAFRPIGDYDVETDFYGDFAPYAHAWIHGQPTVLNGFRGPFYYLLLGVSGEVIRDYFLAAKLISVLAAVAGLRILGGLVRRLWGVRPAFLSMLFVAGNAVFVSLSFRACTDMLFFMLTAAALSLWFPGGDDGKPGLRRGLAAGAVAGLAYLTRYHGLFLLFGVVLTAPVLLRPRRRTWGRVALFVAGWAVAVLPWSFFLWRETGDPLWNTTYQNIAGSLYASSPGAAINGRFSTAVGFQSLLEVVRVDPWRMLRSAIGNGAHYLGWTLRDLVTLPWAVAGGLGLLLAVRRPPGRIPAAFGILGFLAYLPLCVIFFSPRFVLPLLIWFAPLFGMLGARGAAWMTKRRWGGIRLSRQPALVLAGILFLAPAVVTNVRAFHLGRDPRSPAACPLQVLALAEAVQRTGVPVGPDTPIVARKPHIGYYLGAPVQSVPTGDLDDIRKQGAHYLFVSDIEARIFPVLEQFLDGSPVPPGFRAVARTQVSIAPGFVRRAAFYAVVDPVSPVAEDAPGPTGAPARRDGLSRLDTVRMNVLAWYRQWDPEQDVGSIVARMSPEARRHPLVLSILGEAALSRGDAGEAMRLFQAASANGGEEAMLQQAGLQYLRGDFGGFRTSVRAYAAGAGITGVPDITVWHRLYTEALNHREYAKAIGTCGACLDLGPGHPYCQKVLGAALLALGENTKAAAVLGAYLERVPGDAAAWKMLGTARGD